MRLSPFRDSVERMTPPLGQDARHGVRTAITWIRSMPRRELVNGRTRVGAAIYQAVALSVARYLEERLAASEVPTERKLTTSE